MAVAYAPVKCEAQKRILRAGVGNALGADKHGRGDAGVVVQGIVNLAANLPVRRAAPVKQPVPRLCQRKAHPPLVYDAAILFLQFHKHHVARLWHAIAAHAQFFLIDRFIQRSADQAVIRRIQIDAQHRSFSIRVHRDARPGDGHKPLVLFLTKQKFLFIAFKRILHPATSLQRTMFSTWPEFNTGTLMKTKPFSLELYPLCEQSRLA